MVPWLSDPIPVELGAGGGGGGRCEDCYLLITPW